MKILHPLLPVLLLSACTTMTPLTKAARDCDLQAVRQLAAGSGMSEPAGGDAKASPLHMAAASCGDAQALSIVRTLVERGAAADPRDGEGRTPLMIAAGGKPQTALFLVEKGADVRARDNAGNTPLILAAAANNREIAETLVRSKADVDTANGEGVTPLINAAIYGDAALVKLLLDAGADPFPGDSSGRGALDYAASYRKEASAELLREAEALREAAAGLPQQIVRIRAIVGRVTGCLMPEAKTYTVGISRDRRANASVNLSGQIVFTQGALRLWDDDTLTFVAAHEIAHDKLGHVGKKIAVSAVTSGIMLVADFFIPGVGLLNHAVNPAVVNNYSKTQELEADKTASEACGKCFGMTSEKQIAIMTKIRQTSQEGGGFWASHPAWSERIENIRK